MRREIEHFGYIFQQIRQFGIGVVARVEMLEFANVFDFLEGVIVCYRLLVYCKKRFCAETLVRMYSGYNGLPSSFLGLEMRPGVATVAGMVEDERFNDLFCC